MVILQQVKYSSVFIMTAVISVFMSARIMSSAVQNTVVMLGNLVSR